MPFYKSLKDRKRYTQDEANFITDRLLALRKGLANHIPARSHSKTVLIGTWNIREFDNNKYGRRLPESYHYIAEVIAAFDICAIQEVKSDMKALEQVMYLLGPNYDYFVTDVTDGNAGNDERMAFVYDKRKILFRKLIGEITIDKRYLEPDETQFARTPFFAAFQAGWFKFVLSTVHLYYGAASGAKLQRRIKEIDHIARTIASKAEKEDENYILLGDFNIVSPEHETMKALKKHEFQIPEGIGPSNLKGNMYYDQIAFNTKRNELAFGSAGVFDMFRYVFRPQDYDVYEPKIAAKYRKGDEAKDKKMYKNQWRTYQISDHNPIWVELEVDYSDAYLRSVQKAPNA